VGRFRTAPRGRRDVAFLWSAETAGQGFGINPSWGGMRVYETMRRERPDFFLHCGDTIYADKPIPAEVALPDGTVWRNLTTAAKSKVAETLDDFRGNYLYNLLDDNVRRFAAEVPQVWQWDDHEVLDNWWLGKDLTGDPRYREKSVALLAARAARAFREYAPLRWHGPDEPERLYRHLSYGPHLDLFVVDLRSYRAPNSHNQQPEEGPETALLADAQWKWLERAIGASRATWKVVAAGLPLGLLVGDGRDAEGRPRQEAIANGPGAPAGRELELARLLRALARKRIRNLVWLCGDVHYTAAHHYHPSRARFADFLPFWEFVSGPLNAGTFGPNRLDDTFGPEVVFQKVPARGGAAPSAGLQFFGRVDIDGATGEMKVSLKDVAGETLFVQRLKPARR
jgi:alkaline phosphatase D